MYIYIIKTVNSFSVRILKLVERHKQTTIDIKRHEWRKKRGVENTYIFR